MEMHIFHLIGVIIMRHVISYDIEENRVRRKLSKLLEGYGVRVQYSVFECEISEKRFQELYKKIFRLTEGMEGSVRFYSICRNCENKIYTIGKPIHKLKELEKNVIII